MVLEEEYTTANTLPVKFGDQVTGSHLIKSDDDDEDTDVPVNTVVVVFLDRSTKWIVVCPKASRAAEHVAFCWFERQDLELIL